MGNLTFGEVTTGPKEAFDFCYFTCIGEALAVGHYCGVGLDRFESVFEEAIADKTFSIEELEALDCDHFIRITIDKSKLMIFIRKSRGISEFTSFLAESLEIFNKWNKKQTRRRRKNGNQKNSGDLSDRQD